MKRTNWTKTGFNVWSKVYDRVVWLCFAGALQAATREWLDELPSGRNVVVLGGGSGWYLPELLKKRTDIRILYIDISEGMINKAAEVIRSSEHAARVKFQCGSAFDQQINCSDVVIAFFFLDMFRPESIERLITTCKTNNNAPSWLVLDFSYPENSPRGVLHKIWSLTVVALISTMYLLFRATCRIEAAKLPNFQAVFRRCDYYTSRSKGYCHGLMRGWLFQPSNAPPGATGAEHDV